MIERAPAAVRNTVYVLIIVGSIVLLYFFWLRGMHFFMVPSSSMEPTLLPHDHIVTLTKDVYERGDIVVLRDPHDEGSYLVKRIVALESDTVSAYDGALFVNGTYVSEPYTNGPIEYEIEGVKIPEDSFFLLGDNRNNSEDSHSWLANSTHTSAQDAYIPRDMIIGKVAFIYLPTGRSRRVKSFPMSESLVLNSQE